MAEIEWDKVAFCNRKTIGLHDRCNNLELFPLRGYKNTIDSTYVFDFNTVLRFFQGERLSHAVGCAFAACLERKQRRDKECGVTMTFDSKTSTFTRSGSFRQPSLTERLQDTRERAVGRSYSIKNLFAFTSIRSK